MGRIADALKRAQQERARQREETPANPADHAGMSSPRKRLAPSESADVLGRAAALSPPPPARPLVVQAAPVLPDDVAREVLALHEPTSDIAEKYRSVRTRLLTSNPGGGPRVLALTSTLPGEGKTITTANLGFSLAELRHLRVAMIDLDFRQRGLSACFQADERPGIAEVLRGEKSLTEICLPAVRENLFLIPAGDPADARPSELLANQAVAKIVRELNERFHYGLVDTPPVNTAADIGLIAPLCHAVIIVIRMNRTPEPLLRRCVKMLQANRVPVAGCILAGFDEKSARYETQDYFEPVT